MKKIPLSILLLLSIQLLHAQFNNEWIDYSKVYYKIKTAADGIYRIPGTALSAAGLGNIQAQDYQLWRNGQQVAIYTSINTGVLGTNDYIEFYGQRNDGKADKALYREAANHLDDKNSLFTDTAVYFLTVNNAGGNLRMQTISNNLTNTPAASAFIWAKVRHNYISNVTGRPYINKGSFENYGEPVYSSAFDKGEMSSSDDIYPNQGGVDFTNRAAVFNNLQPYTGGGAAKLKFAMAGVSRTTRDVRFSINGTALGEKRFSIQDARLDSFTNIATTNLQQAQTIVGILNLGRTTAQTEAQTNVNDRIVAGFVELEYPRLPNAGGQSNLSFFVPAGTADTYLEITNMPVGTTVPVLYNLTTGSRMVTSLSGSTVRIRIPATTSRQEFLLATQAAGAYTELTTLTSRSFNNYSVTGNQGNYIIITNSRLLDGGATNPVRQYADYRRSTAGGAYSPLIYDIEELTDQFAFGIKMHPLSIKNFLKFARQKFATKPSYCFLIGKGVNYGDFREKENQPSALSLSLVPTFGWPASDNLLASDDLNALPATFIGRLNVVTSAEVTDYLNKVKEYEAAQANTTQTQAEKAWMKNLVHVVGANDANTALSITPYMTAYKSIAESPAFGGKVTTFNKFNSTTASNIESEQISTLFQNGFSLLTYFGHSSATVLDYNLDDPSQYNNPGKYPAFLLLGCNAGNFFDYDQQRLQLKSTISEKYVLAKGRGAIGMIASTHYGIVNGLGLYSNGYYQSFANKSYGKSLGQNIYDAVQYMTQQWGADNYQVRIHTEQQTLHGDPAIKMNNFGKPDFSIESSNVVINPSFISIAETNFKTKIYFYNLGKAINDSITVLVKRQYPITEINPTVTTDTVFFKKVKSPNYIDSIDLTLPIMAERDKGTNKIIIQLETENKIDELSENNNSVTADVEIYENDLRTVYPYNYSIINKQGIKLVASTSNPFSASQTYRMEMDTTALFNSGFKITKDVVSTGGIVEFDPTVTFRDSTVYYWRLAVVPASGTPDRWNDASFTYINGTETGFNQSHLYQHTKSTANRIHIDSTSRQWAFDNTIRNLFINHSVYGTPGYVDDGNVSVYINSSIISTSACLGHSIIFNVFDPVTFKPMRNYPGGLYGSGLNSCDATNFTRQYNFEWMDQTPSARKMMADFMDAIPNGSYVVVRKILDQPFTDETFAEKMKADQTTYGIGNTLYDKLKSAGFSNLDSFSRPRTFIFIYKKNDNSFSPRVVLSQTENDAISLQVDCNVADTLGYITSPNFGPAKSWKQAQWRGNTPDGKAGDLALVDVVGITTSGNENTLYTLTSAQQNFDISQVNATTYPYLKLRMRNADSVNNTPYNLRWWRLYYNPVPEGALAPNVSLQAKDSLASGEPLEFKIAFKNISQTAFTDSINVTGYIKDKNRVDHVLSLKKQKALIVGDTAIINFSIDTKSYPGLNTLYIAVNPEGASYQPEQYFFNNFLYKNFYVNEDAYNPLLDVTFDGVHILNQDIVSAKPHIQIKLKDENSYLSLNDTAGLTIRLKYPTENNARTYQWATDTLRFTSPANTSADNTATIDFTPTLNEDSQNSTYELTVSGKDITGNRAGSVDYKITFQVFNKPMISNLLNYPNPFSTSTAFVFTLTGSQVPQEFKIQILTITGKIVKEISRQELGDIRIGTNVTDYKWDGTDMYGSKLANGVYLYRVVTSLDGKKMDKFTLNNNFDQTAQDDTDKFFNKGYGKMVILR